MNSDFNRFCRGKEIDLVYVYSVLRRNEPRYLPSVTFQPPNKFV